MFAHPVGTVALHLFEHGHLDVARRGAPGVAQCPAITLTSTPWRSSSVAMVCRRVMNRVA
jgi:hypothetical protein